MFAVQLYFNLFMCRHTIEKNRWINFSLMPSSEKPNERISIRNAIRIWLNTANSTNPVQFRDGCYLTHCNEMCPEAITFEQDESFLWQHGYEVFIYCIVATVTIICFIIKGVFSLWYWRLLCKQKQFMQQARDAEKMNATYLVCVYVCVCMYVCARGLVGVCIRACVRACCTYVCEYTDTSYM